MRFRIRQEEIFQKGHILESSWELPLGVFGEEGGDSSDYHTGGRGGGGGNQPGQSSTPATAGGGNSGGTAMGIAEFFTTPTGGGEWEVDWTSTMSPAQRKFYENLLKNAGGGSAQQAEMQGSLDPEQFSITGFDAVNNSNAITSYKSFLDAQANREKIQAESEIAKREAMEAMGEVGAQFAGGGLRSSASTRAAGKVQENLGTNIAQIRAKAMEDAENRRLAATQGLGGLEAQFSAQELQRLIADQSTAAGLATTQFDIANRIAMLNAELGTNYDINELQYLLGLVNVTTGENIATQTPVENLHKEIFGPGSIAGGLISGGSGRGWI